MRATANKIHLISKPDFLSVLEREGISLFRRGRYFWACCPFHSEKTPSFKVDPERQTFYCFGCHRHGDVIAFVMERHGLSFKEALAYLDIGEALPDPIRASEEKEQRELAEAFRAWEKSTGDSISLFLREYRKMRATRRDYTEAELVLLTELQGRFDYLEYLYEEVFCKNDDEAKLQLFKEEYEI